jgi:hypothetical protein
MSTAALRTRSFVYPLPGDRVSTVAARVLPGDPDALKTLLSWNLHLITRRSLTKDLNPSTDPELLGTDIVYTEAPLA